MNTGLGTSPQGESHGFVGFKAVTAVVMSVARWLLARLIIEPEDGGDSFLRNISSHTDHTEL
jgi:hypothetical protein